MRKVIIKSVLACAVITVFTCCSWWYTDDDCLKCEGPNGNYRAMLIKSSDFNEMKQNNSLNEVCVLGYFFQPTTVIPDPMVDHLNLGFAQNPDLSIASTLIDLEIYAMVAGSSILINLGIIPIRAKTIAAINSHITSTFVGILSTTGFYAEEIQYSSIYNGLENTFISSAEMDFMLNQAEWIAISGAYINLGNIQVIEDSNGDLEGTFPEKMSTFKLAGFNEVNDNSGRHISEAVKIQIQNEFAINLDSVQYRLFEQDSIISYNKIGGDEEGVMVPLSTVMAPCPPRWVPQ